MQKEFRKHGRRNGKFAPPTITLNPANAAQEALQIKAVIKRVWKVDLAVHNAHTLEIIFNGFISTSKSQVSDVPAEDVFARGEGRVPVKGAKLDLVLDVPGVRGGGRGRQPMRNIIVHMRVQDRLVLSNPS